MKTPTSRSSVNKPPIHHAPRANQAFLTAILTCSLFSACAQSPIQEIPCTGKTPTQTGYWYPTVTPSEAGTDGARHHVFDAACSVTNAGTRQTLSAQAPSLQGLYNTVTRGPGELYALGGTYGQIDDTNGPYVVSLDAHGLTQRWRTALPGLRPGDWDYPGALAVGVNGDLYVIYGPHMARLDPATGAIKSTLDLPVNQAAADVSYNGFIALSDGKFVAKSVHRAPGCQAPDFQAFLACSTSGLAASTLALIDPDAMRVLQTVIAPEHIRFRTTSTRFAGNEYVYMPGDQHIYRYRYNGSNLALDSWSAEYLTSGQTSGTAVAEMDNWIVVQTNGLPTAAPLSIVAINQADATQQYRVQPFAKQTTLGSFNPSMPTVDAVNRRVYVFDGYVGHVAALDFAPGRGFSIAWDQTQRSFAFSALVGPPSQRTFIGTDMSGPLADLVFNHLGLDAKQWLLKTGSQLPEAIVWRDAANGRELSRSGLWASVGGSVIAPGADGSLIAPDLLHAHLLRFAATSSAP